MTTSTNIHQPAQLSIYPSPVGNIGFLSAPSGLGYLPFPAIEWWFLTGTVSDGTTNYSLMNNLITTQTDPDNGTANQEIMSSFQFQRNGVAYQAINTYGGEMASEIVQSLQNSVLIEQPQINPTTEDDMDITSGKADGLPYFHLNNIRDSPPYQHCYVGKLGQPGTRYQFKLQTQTWLHAWKGGVLLETVPYLQTVNIAMADRRGVISEGINCFVGSDQPEQMSGKMTGSYEYAMSRLEVSSWKVTLTSLQSYHREIFPTTLNFSGQAGLVWLDRQGLTNPIPRQLCYGVPVRSNNIGHGYPNGLYCGCWIACNFSYQPSDTAPELSGLTVLANAFWNTARPTNSDHDATQGFCNVYPGIDYRTSDLDTSSAIGCSVGVDVIDRAKIRYPYRIQCEYSLESDKFATGITITIRANTQLRYLLGFQCASGNTVSDHLVQDVTQDFSIQLQAYSSHSMINHFSQLITAPFSEIAATITQVQIGNTILTVPTSGWGSAWIEQMPG